MTLPARAPAARVSAAARAPSVTPALDRLRARRAGQPTDAPDTRRLVVDAQLDELEHVIHDSFVSPNDLSLRYERDLLHVLLWQDAELRPVRELVDESDFLVPVHATLFAAICWQADELGFVDAPLLAEQMLQRGRRDLLAITSDYPAAALPHRATAYARQIRRRAVHRGLEAVAWDRLRGLRGAAVFGLDHHADPHDIDAAARDAEALLLARLPE